MRRHRRKVRTRPCFFERRRTVAGNARRGNPRDANRDVRAERRGNPQGLADMETCRVQRLKSYLRARSCLSQPRVEIRESLEVCGNVHPRYMIAQFTIRSQDRIRDKIRLIVAGSEQKKKDPQGSFFFVSTKKWRPSPVIHRRTSDGLLCGRPRPRSMP